MHPARTALARLLLACTALLLGACAVRADAAPDQRTSITMQRTSCFGICPSYTVTADADGQVNFTGHLHVQTAQASGHVTPAQVAEILAVAEQVGFRSMQNSYVSEDDGCGNMMTDQPGVKITVTDASGSKTVDFYFGCVGGVADAVRPRIRQLADTIDKQLDTARWVGKPATGGGGESVDR